MNSTAGNWTFIRPSRSSSTGWKSSSSFRRDLPPVYGHYIDFSQSFRNLLVNALEAMEAEGAPVRRLTVMTALEDRPAPPLRG